MDIDQEFDSVVEVANTAMAHDDYSPMDGVQQSFEAYEVSDTVYGLMNPPTTPPKFADVVIAPASSTSDPTSYPSCSYSYAGPSSLSQEPVNPSDSRQVFDLVTPPRHPTSTSISPVHAADTNVSNRLTSPLTPSYSSFSASASTPGNPISTPAPRPHRSNGRRIDVEEEEEDDDDVAANPPIGILADEEEVDELDSDSNSSPPRNIYEQQRREARNRERVAASSSMVNRPDPNPNFSSHFSKQNISSHKTKNSGQANVILRADTPDPGSSPELGMTASSRALNDRQELPPSPTPTSHRRRPSATASVFPRDKYKEEKNHFKLDQLSSHNLSEYAEREKDVLKASADTLKAVRDPAIGGHTRFQSPTSGNSSRVVATVSRQTQAEDNDDDDDDDDGIEILSHKPAPNLAPPAANPKDNYNGRSNSSTSSSSSNTTSKGKASSAGQTNGGNTLDRYYTQAATTKGSSDLVSKSASTTPKSSARVGSGPAQGMKNYKGTAIPRLFPSDKSPTSSSGAKEGGGTPASRLR